ncbi:hypothetical protein SpCBS45565_g03696 [Spizellomyces sp. 'palustris']|nr:hypothetical protein SpCBS45565_g03696 [Spizellomyces sp. 'palustris']
MATPADVDEVMDVSEETAVSKVAKGKGKDASGGKKRFEVKKLPDADVAAYRQGIIRLEPAELERFLSHAKQYSAKKSMFTLAHQDDTDDDYGHQTTGRSQSLVEDTVDGGSATLRGQSTARSWADVVRANPEASADELLVAMHGQAEVREGYWNGGLGFVCEDTSSLSDVSALPVIALEPLYAANTTDEEEDVVEEFLKECAVFPVF